MVDSSKRLDEPKADEVVAFAVALNNTATRAAELLKATLQIVATKVRGPDPSEPPRVDTRDT
jgi:hypothetical protein